jgi:hypothetical protein
MQIWHVPPAKKNGLSSILSPDPHTNFTGDDDAVATGKVSITSYIMVSRKGCVVP